MERRRTLISSVKQKMLGQKRRSVAARAALGVASLPRGAQVEIDAVMVLPRRERDKD